MSSTHSPLTVATGLDGLVGSFLTLEGGSHPPIHSLGEWGQGFDITDQRCVESALDRFPDARTLLHLAAFTDTQAAHQESGDRSGMCYQVNVLGTRHLAQACAERGIHMVTVSTDYVFGGDSDFPYKEEDAPGPIDWYGKTKLMGELETQAVPSWTIVRLAFPYGPLGRGGGLLGKMMKTWERDEALHLFQDQTITPTCLEDIGRGLQSVCAIKPHNEIIHLAGADWTSPYEFGQAIADVYGLDRERIHPTRLGDVAARDQRPRHRSLRLDTSKWVEMAAGLGVPKPVGIVEGLKLSKEKDSPGAVRSKPA